MSSLCSRRYVFTLFLLASTIGAHLLGERPRSLPDANTNTEEAITATRIIVSSQNQSNSKEEADCSQATTTTSTPLNAHFSASDTEVFSDLPFESKKRSRGALGCSAKLCDRRPQLMIDSDAELTSYVNACGLRELVREPSHDGDGALAAERLEPGTSTVYY